jgi:cellulose synthase/poly-beta-1,6-N-acetylglucosamine synthase-like glycosyltransferase
MNYKGISVGIPARNEESTIKQTVDSITKGYQGPPLEILVCVSASTDNTADVVRELEEKDGRVKLIKEKKRGKPAAWNRIVEVARYDDMVLSDGDVLFGKGSTTTLINEMHARDLSAVTARQHALIPQTGSKAYDALLNALHYPFNPFILSGPYLCGRLYSMNRPKVLEHMEKKGYAAMPEVINEDTWLSLVLEDRNEDKKILKRHWGYCKDAVVYFHVPTLADQRRHNKRLTNGHVQLEREHPQLRYDARQPGEPSTMLNRLLSTEYIDSSLQQVLTAMLLPIQTTVHGTLWFEALEESYGTYKKPRSTVWEIIESTKTRFSKDAVKEAGLMPVPAKE